MRPPGAATPRRAGDAVRRHCEQRLARFKLPRRIEVVDELPLTVTGKVAEGPAAGHRAAPRAGAAGVSAGARVTLYSKPGCHLCDDAREVVARVCADLGEAYTRSTSTTTRTLDGALRRGDPGDLRRRPPARLLAGRRAACAPRSSGPARALDRTRPTCDFGHMC